MAAATTNNVDDNASIKKKKDSFEPQPDWTLISQGAEARLYQIPKYLTSDKSALAKQRFSKSYRHFILDERLTKQRCKAEAKCLLKCRRAGIHCPAILGVHAPVLYMEFIQGSTVRDYIENVVSEQMNGDCKERETCLQELSQGMGDIIGRVHNVGVAHGDLTTSNMMLSNNTIEGLTLIDFGLARITSNPEEMAVDLYVLERALLSTHPKLESTGFLDTMLASYKATCTKSHAVLLRLGQVRSRGRKRECFG